MPTINFCDVILGLQEQATEHQWITCIEFFAIADMQIIIDEKQYSVENC